MKEPRSNQTPYKTLGGYLKRAREARRESLSEVAGAVEIEATVLQAIEEGYQRPSEDILLLLIDHLELVDRDASEVWESAGYSNSSEQTSDSVASLKDLAKNAAFVVLASDTRTLHTDGMEVYANQNSVTVQFNQTGPNGTQPVSRIGMSYEQAQQFVDILQSSLLYRKYGRGPKGLPE